MRRAVWRRLDARFRPGQRVLEVNCGTGEDAVYLARRGIEVLATDVSKAMVEAAAVKAAAAGVDDRVETRPLDLDRLAELPPLPGAPFDGLLSNFGGLNCVADLAAVGAGLAGQLRSGAVAMLCIMGPVVPWEWLWFLLHARPGKAFRRLTPGGVAWRDLHIRYPSPGAARRRLAPWFRPLRTAAVGTLVPPPYTEAWAGRFPRLLAVLGRWEARLERLWPLPWLADHYLLELERR